MMLGQYSSSSSIIKEKKSFELVKSCSSDSANTIIQRARRRLKRSQHHASSANDIDRAVTGIQYGRPKRGLGCFTCGADPSLILEPHVPSAMDRIVIIGAGAVGGFVGCCLAGENSKIGTSYTPQVTFLVRNHRDVERHARTGFAAHSVIDTDFRASISPSEAKKIFATDPSCLREASCVFVATKRTSNATVHRWCAMYTVTCPVVFLQIGLYLRDDLTTAARLMGSSALGKQGIKYEVIEAIVSMNVDMNKETGIVTVGQAVKDTLIVLDGKQPSAKAVCELFKESVLTVRPESERDIVSLQAANLQLNLINAVHALSGKTVADTLREYEYRLVLSLCVDESREVFQAHGIPIRAVKETDLQLKLMSSFLRSWNMVFLPVMNTTLELLPKTSSLATDIANCMQPTEIEFINGAIVRLGRLVGVDCPVNAKLVELVQRAETLRMGSPKMSARSLLTELGLAPSPQRRMGESSRGNGVPQLLSFDSFRTIRGTTSSLTSGHCSSAGDSGRSLSRSVSVTSSLAFSFFSSDNGDQELLGSPPVSPVSLRAKEEHSPPLRKVTEGIPKPYIEGAAKAKVTVDRNGGIRLWT
jgi:2-dehydropantoate 2-reductase